MVYERTAAMGSQGSVQLRQTRPNLDRENGNKMSYSVEGVAGSIYGSNDNDEDGNPHGGRTEGAGYHFDWQAGPLNREAGEVPNGAFVEDVMFSCIMRLRFYQGLPYTEGGYIANDGRFACDENAQALALLTYAHDALMRRRKDRIDRGVLGKHEV